MQYKNWTELKLVKIIKLLNSEIMVGGAYDVIPSCAPTKVLIDVLVGLMVVICQNVPGLQPPLALII